MIRTALLALSLCLAAIGSPAPLAKEATAPLSPRDVVEIQLDALAHNDEPVPDAGIARAWEFAHPANKLATGPLDRFTRMLRSEAYAALIGHRRHEIEEVSTSGDTAIFKVTITGADNAVSGFAWILERVSADQNGPWLTSAVTRAALIGREI
jgi:hypothetical protein